MSCGKDSCSLPSVDEEQDVEVKAVRDVSKEPLGPLTPKAGQFIEKAETPGSIGSTAKTYLSDASAVAMGTAGATTSTSSGCDSSRDASLEARGETRAPSKLVGRTRSKLQTAITAAWSATRSPEVKVGRRLPSSNANGPQDYLWLEETLSALARNEADALGCRDGASGKAFTPIFFVIGGCPNIFCGMQAVMYSVSGDREVDFWWVKPSKGSHGVEHNTLSRHAKGPHKNDPGRSKQFYKPLADVFTQGHAKDGLSFGIEAATASPQRRAARAFVDLETKGRRERMYLHLVWQEEWSTNPFTRSKYVKGRIIYQLNLEAGEFYSRQYLILNGVMNILDIEGRPTVAVLPSDEVKELFDWVPGQPLALGP